MAKKPKTKPGYLYRLVAQVVAYFNQHGRSDKVIKDLLKLGARQKTIDSALKRLNKPWTVKQILSWLKGAPLTDERIADLRARGNKESKIQSAVKKYKAQLGVKVKTKKGTKFVPAANVFDLSGLGKGTIAPQNPESPPTTVSKDLYQMGAGAVPPEDKQEISSKTLLPPTSNPAPTADLFQQTVDRFNAQRRAVAELRNAQTYKEQAAARTAAINAGLFV